MVQKYLYPLLICLAVFVVTAKPLYINADTKKFDEYEVKAAFIYNFIKFIEWPDELNKNQSAPLNICIIGNNPFGRTFADMQGKQARGRYINIGRSNPPKDLKACHIMFVSSSEKQRLPEILKSIKGFNILTIGDTEGFAGQGIMINFYMEGQRVRFEINLDAAKREGLTISSRLLGLAKIVQNIPKHGEK